MNEELVSKKLVANELVDYLTKLKNVSLIGIAGIVLTLLSSVASSPIAAAVGCGFIVVIMMPLRKVVVRIQELKQKYDL